MGESLIERRRVQEEGLRPVNCFSLGTSPALNLLEIFWFVQKMLIIQNFFLLFF